MQHVMPPRKPYNINTTIHTESKKRKEWEKILIESEQNLKEEEDTQIRTKIPSLYQFIISVQYYRRFLEDIINNFSTLNIDKTLLTPMLELQKTSEYITNKEKFTEFTHLITKIYKELDNNTIFIITNNYPTKSITEETISQLKQEIKTLRKDDTLLNHQKSVLTIHKLFPLNLIQPQQKRRQNRKESEEQTRTNIQSQNPHKDNNILKLQRRLQKRNRT